jgi:heat-inducible transcriptional repressor
MFKEGWENVLNEPEFEDANFMKEFIGAVEGLEKNIDNLEFEQTNIKVYIGKENPTSKTKEFSVIVSQTNLPNGKKSKIVLVGPKRMEYERNIGLMSAMQRLFED